MKQHPTAADEAATRELTRKVIAICSRDEVHPAIAVAALTEVIAAILVTLTQHPDAAMQGAHAVNHRIMMAIGKQARDGSKDSRPAGH